MGPGPRTLRLNVLIPGPRSVSYSFSHEWGLGFVYADTTSPWWYPGPPGGDDTGSRPGRRTFTGGRGFPRSIYL